MLTIHLLKPVQGTHWKGEKLKAWRLDTIVCSPLSPGQVPPVESLVNNIAVRAFDRQERPIPKEVLRQYDLDRGLREALRKVWA